MVEVEGRKVGEVQAAIHRQTAARGRSSGSARTSSGKVLLAYLDRAHGGLLGGTHAYWVRECAREQTKLFFKGDTLKEYAGKLQLCAVNTPSC